jgi:hypothetical protein
MRTLLVHLAVAIVFLLLVRCSPTPRPSEAASALRDATSAVTVASIPASLVYASGPTPSRAEHAIEPPGPARTAFPTGCRVRLRRAPDPNSPVVATFTGDTARDARFAVLGATADFVHVEASGPETRATRSGWAPWSEVLADTSAIVVDVASGDVVARVPLDATDLGVVVSPDGARVAFHPTGACGEDAPGAVYELRSDDFGVARVVRAPGDLQGNSVIVGAWYDAGDAGLRVAFVTGHRAASRLFVARVDDAGGLGAPVEIATNIHGFVVARDAATGFVLHTPAVAKMSPILTIGVDVVDLARLEVVSSYMLDRNVPVWWAEDFVTDDRGRELTVASGDGVVVADARTGKILRRTRVGRPNESLQVTGSVDGVPLVLATRWRRDETAVRRSYWVEGSSTLPCAAPVALAVATPGGRLGVDADGTRLYRLDASGGATSLAIARPELGHGSAYEVPAEGLAATQDGTRAIVVVSVADG